MRGTRYIKLILLAWRQLVLASLIVVFGSVVLTGTGAVLAVEPDEILKDAALEKRARTISAQLRCLVCQNQSIDDSNAPLARDLRVLVRERLTAGDNDGQVFEYVVARYGDYVLLKPPFNAYTLILWLTPFLVLLVASLLLYRSYIGRATSADAVEEVGLSSAEQAELDRILALNSADAADDNMDGDIGSKS